MSADKHPAEVLDDKPVHFGPVWGRGPGESMALCAPALVAGQSNTMTRSATVTCHRCVALLSNIKEPANARR